MRSEGYGTWSVCVCVCVCLLGGEGKRKRFARVCMHTVGECFQRVRGIFHGHTRWAFEYPAQLRLSPWSPFH